jgi:ribosomal protein S18 acetylase RimI-like enzyme
MVSNVRISRFTLSDAGRFSKLRNDIDNESDHVLAKKGERKESSLHVIARLLISRRRIITFLAYDGDFPIGYVSLVFPKFIKLRGNAYLTIAVRREYRGRGVGSKLMEQAEDYAKRRGVRRMELEVFSKNEPAITLYKKRGYEIEGVKKDTVEAPDGYDDIVIMAKKLQ